MVHIDPFVIPEYIVHILTNRKKKFCKKKRSKLFSLLYYFQLNE